MINKNLFPKCGLSTMYLIRGLHGFIRFVEERTLYFPFSWVSVWKVSWLKAGHTGSAQVWQPGVHRFAMCPAGNPALSSML